MLLRERIEGTKKTFKIIEKKFFYSEKSLIFVYQFNYSLPKYIFMLNIETLKNFINDGGKATHGHIVALTEQKMLKTGNPLRDAEVTKLVSYIAALNVNYANCVNNALEREGKDKNFVAKEAWFTKVYDNFNGSIVAKKSDLNCHYLMFVLKKAVTHRYFVNGVEATAEQVEVIRQFKQSSSSPKNQNLDSPIQPLTIKTENIISVKTGGEELFLNLDKI